MSPLKIDAHVHVWARAEDSDTYPFAGQLTGAASSTEPPLPGHAEVLSHAMDAAGVSGALIVQPGNHLYDHRYVTSVLRAAPSRFLGCLLADPRPDGGGKAELRRLVVGVHICQELPSSCHSSKRGTVQCGSTPTCGPRGSA